jgi:hypothetical protein
MRHGKAPTIRKGRYSGDQVSVDPIIPCARVPDLGNVITIVQLLPLRLNESKNDKMGARQRALVKQLRRADLLSQ